LQIKIDNLTSEIDVKNNEITKKTNEITDLTNSFSELQITLENQTKENTLSRLQLETLKE
jgi:prefoldin subunit 5